MRYDGEHKERTRLRLLTEAAIMLREEGPHGLSVVTLMKRQGLTHGGFYAHFESKDELIGHAIMVMFERTCERFILRTRGLSPEAGLISYISYYLSPAHCNKPGQGCPIPAISADVARLEPLARKRFEAGLGSLQRLVSAKFERMGYETVSAENEALVLLSELSGAVIMARAVKSTALSRQICNNAQGAILKRLNLVAPEARDITSADTKVDAEVIGQDA